MAVASVQVETKQDYYSVGKSVQRIDSFSKITGDTKYTFDLEVPRMLYGKIKRSTVAHGRIVSVDTSKAEKLEGVRAVMTSADIPDKLYGYGLNDESILPRDKVRFVGEPVAAVAADTEEIAKEAVDLIEVKYEELQAIFDPEESIQPKPSVVVHPEKNSYVRTYAFGMTEPDLPNVSAHMRIRKGDVEKGFREADSIVESKFTIHMVQHSPIEVHACIVDVAQDGNVTVWTSSQQPYLLLIQFSTALDIPASKVRIIVPPLGGGFGGKTQMKLEPFALVLSRKSRRPVKITMTREEEFIATTVRQPFVVTVKDGLTKDGRIKARQVKYILNSGAYTEDSLPVTRNASFGAACTYRFENFQVDGYCVYTNLPIGGAYRGFGSAELEAAIEQQMDIDAERIGMDKVEFRAMNLLREGEKNATGETMRAVGSAACLDAVVRALARAGVEKTPSGPWRTGTGLALGQKYSLAPSVATAIVKVHPDATVEVRTSAIEMGQGVLTVLAQMASEEFKIPIERVKMVGVDTLITPYDHGAISSRSTFNIGNAVRLACQDAKRQLFEIASKKLGVPANELDVAEGRIFQKDSRDRSMGIIECFERLNQVGYFLPVGGEILGKATWHTKTDGLDEVDGHALGQMVNPFYTYTAQVAVVSVNIETGEVKLLRFINACDVGKAINPKGVIAQIEGGSVMGISSAILEELVFDNGRAVNADFMGYRPITAQEAPPIESIIIETIQPDGPFGAKGAGEVPLVVSAATVANAIADAVGVRIRDYPLTPERILRALKQKRQ